MPITSFRDRQMMVDEGWDFSSMTHGNSAGSFFEGWGESARQGRMGYVLTGSGQAKVVYSNKHISTVANNEVKLYLNDVLLDTAPGDAEQRTVQFNFVDGDLLLFTEGFAIINLFEITISRPCEECVNGPNDQPCLNGGSPAGLEPECGCVCTPYYEGDNCEIPKAPMCDTVMPITNFRDRQMMVDEGWDFSSMTHGNNAGSVFEGWGESARNGRMGYVLSGS